jgi:alpha-1,2-mannosyltransferase
VLAPGESVRYFGELLWRTDRVGAVDAVANQSLAGMLARLADTATAPRSWWVPLVLIVLVTGLRRARLAHERGDTVTALTLVGLTANLVSPVSWTHHLVFLPVAALLLAGLAADHRRPRHAAAAVAVLAVCIASPIWFRPEHPVLGNAFALTLLALVAALPVSAAPAAGAGAPGPARDASPAAGRRGAAVRGRSRDRRW